LFSQELKYKKRCHLNYKLQFGLTCSTERAAARADPSACERDEQGENRWQRRRLLRRRGADDCGGGGGGGDRCRRDDDGGDDDGGVRVPRQQPTETHRRHLRRRPARRA